MKEKSSVKCPECGSDGYPKKYLGEQRVGYYLCKNHPQCGIAYGGQEGTVKAELLTTAIATDPGEAGETRDRLPVALTKAQATDLLKSKPLEARVCWRDVNHASPKQPGAEINCWLQDGVLVMGHPTDPNGPNIDTPENAVYYELPEGWL